MAHTPEHKKAIEDAINKMLGKSRETEIPKPQIPTPSTVHPHVKTIWDQFKNRKKQIDEAVGGE